VQKCHSDIAQVNDNVIGNFASVLLSISVSIKINYVITLNYDIFPSDDCLINIAKINGNLE
jgi:hypothetical protein